MLTGDKVDTAINIGFSCSLLTTDMELLRLVADDGDMALDEERVPVQDAIENAFTQLLSGRTHQERALVVDTGALAAVIKFGLEARMLELCGMCKSVICARVSPKQKAKVVEMVRRARPAMVTLAIGDGANDVPMIQTANVGIGIFGLEGKQAVMTADYAIGQFRFLKPLLLVHGRWHYRRVATIITYTYYKSAVQVFPQFLFGFASLFSGQRIFYDPFYQMYNVAYTSLPIFILGLFDQDVSADTALKTPSLYLDGIKHVHDSTKIFWTWMCEAGAHSLAVAFIPLLAIGKADILHDGQVGGLFDYGAVVFLCVMLAVNARLVFEFKMVTVFVVAAVSIHFLGFWLTYWLYGTPDFTYSFWGPQMLQLVGSYGMLSSSPYLWFSIIAVTVVVTGLSLTIHGFVSVMRPPSSLVAREIEKIEKKGLDGVKSRDL